MQNEIEKAIKALLAQIQSRGASADSAMKLSQAVLNLANASRASRRT